MDILINELSLDSQFDNIEEFVKYLPEVIKCLRTIDEEECLKLYKHSDLFNRQITPEMKFSDIRKIRGNDYLTRIKSVLLRLSDSPPFWDDDVENIHQDIDKKYMNGDVDVSATSIAEAVAREGIALSFHNEKFRDLILDIKEGDKEYKLHSAVSSVYLTEKLYNVGAICQSLYLKNKYENTRLKFDEFDNKYGIELLQKEELEEVIRAFDRFSDKVSWQDIYEDRSFHFKEYQPNSKKNDWFASTKFSRKEICKFRCGNRFPIRCFGYREKEYFYILRIERDHKISDNG